MNCFLRLSQLDYFTDFRCFSLDQDFVWNSRSIFNVLNGRVKITELHSLSTSSPNPLEPETTQL